MDKPDPIEGARRQLEALLLRLARQAAAELREEGLRALEAAARLRRIK